MNWFFINIQNKSLDFSGKQENQATPENTEHLASPENPVACNFGAGC